MPKQPETMYVRLKAGAKGQPRRYLYAAILFESAKGWYEVDLDVAEHLATVRENRDDDRSPLFFEVVPEAQAKLIDRREQEQAARRGAASPTAAHRAALNMTRRGVAASAAAARKRPSLAVPADNLETGDLTTEDLRRGVGERPRGRRAAASA